MPAAGANGMRFSLRAARKSLMQVVENVARLVLFCQKRNVSTETAVSSDEAAYFQRRAEQELELAQSAKDPKAAKAHYLIASAYLDRVHGPGTNDGSAK